MITFYNTSSKAFILCVVVVVKIIRLGLSVRTVTGFYLYVLA